jgi:hypothetical protein
MERFVDYSEGLLAFLRANAGGNRMLVTESLPQDVVFLDSVPSIATLWGLIYSLFPRDVEFSSSNHTARRKCLHFRGLEQAAAKIYINIPKNTGFFKNYTQQVLLFFVKSTRVTFILTTVK